MISVCDQVLNKVCNNDIILILSYYSSSIMCCCKTNTKKKLYFHFVCVIFIIGVWIIYGQIGVEVIMSNNVQS
jgi:hypothetical protein